MKQGRRRSILKLSLFGCAALLAGCGGGSSSSAVQTPAPPPPSAQGWNVTLPVFAVGSNTTFDLAQTLPAGVPQGGTFGISPNGAPLPSGMSLSTAGIFSIGTAQIGQTTGVLFTYVEPGA